MNVALYSVRLFLMTCNISDFNSLLNNTLTSPHILIIDDDKDISSVLRAALEVVGCRVSTESDSSKAEEACRLAMPDLVLIDLMMPGRSGIDLIGPLNEIAPDAIICITTGMGDPALLNRSLKSGAWNVLCKPYSLTELGDLINLALRLSESLREEKMVGDDAASLNLEFPGDHKPTAADLARLIAVAAGSGVDSDVAYRKLPLLASELLDNAYEHGVQGDPTKSYGVQIKLEGSSLKLSVWNTGKSFDGQSVVKQKAFAIPKGKLSGLQLASVLADEMRFGLEPNSVSLLWHLTQTNSQGNPSK